MNVSVLIGSYGDPGYRELAYTRALPSAQAASPFEVVIDHFPDGDVNTMRNELAARARGEWLCFLDADDELHPHYIGAMTLAASRHPGKRMLLTPEVERRYANGRVQRARFIRPVDLDHGNWLVIGTLIERELFEELGGFGAWPHGLEDWHLWARAARAGAIPVRARGAIYIVHWNPDSAHMRLAAKPDEYRLWYDQVHAEILAS